MEKLAVFLARELLALGDVRGLLAELLNICGVDLCLAFAVKPIKLAVKPPHFTVIGNRTQGRLLCE